MKTKPSHPLAGSFWLALFLLVEGVLGCEPGLAQVSAAPPGGSPSPPSEPPRLDARRLTEPIVLDGRLDEAFWVATPPAADFVQIDPTTGEPATRATEVRIGFDEQAIFLGVSCFDDAGPAGVRVPDLRRDFEEEQNDYFGVVLGPFRDDRTAQAFLVNPWGAQRDLQVSDDTLTDLDWDAPWTVRTTLDARGWTAEIAIPWSTLRYPAGATEWSLQLVRRVRRLEEVSGWAPWPRGMSAYRMSFAGVLAGLEPPPPKRQLRFQPYVLARAGRLEQEGERRDEEELELGGEVRWLPTPATVLDLTLNTDFAQAEVDRQVVNLSRFSVLFPERRQFFLENSGLFDSGFDDLKPFFSRRIGLDDAGRPLAIEAGARLVHQNAERRWGGLAVRTAAEGESPASTFGVARWSENLGQRHRLGAMLVGRRDEAGGGHAARTNGVAMFDGLYRPHELLTVQGFVSASSTTGDGGDGLAGSLWAYTRGPRGYLGWVQQFVSDEYEAAAGFVSRSNLITTSPAGTLDWRPAWLPSRVRNLKPNFVGYLYHAWDDGSFQEGWVRLEPLWVVFQDGSEVWSWWEPNWQRLETPFSPLPGLEVAPGEYNYERWGFAGATDRSHAYGIEMRHTTGGFFDGRLDSTKLTLRVRPSPRLSLVLDYQRDAIRDLGPARGRRTTELWAPELRLALDPRLQMTIFYQRNTAAGLASWYSRLAWEIAPLSYLYVVYSDLAPTGLATDPLGRPDFRDRQLVVKLSYLWQS